MTEDPWIGKEIEGKYLILDALGAGGMGVVYRAKHLMLGTELALKMINPAAAATTDSQQRFLREAQVATKLVHKKSIFSFLTDPTYTHILSPRQREAIDRHIPWTRILRDHATPFRGLHIDLLEFIRANRRHFVVKPNDEYGGKGVTIGFAASESEWDDAIADGLRWGHVVQEVVDIHFPPLSNRQYFTCVGNVVRTRDS